MDKNNNPQQPRNKKNTFSTIFLPLLLVVGMCLTFYFVFVKPSTGSSSRNTENYTQADLVLDSDKKINEYSLDYGGKLTNILLGQEVTKLQSKYSYTGNYYSIAGYYTKVNDAGKKVRIIFRADLSADSSSWALFQDIIEQAPLYQKDAEGNIKVDANTGLALVDQDNSKYYSGSRNIYDIISPESGNGFASWLPTILVSVVLIGLSIFLVSRFTKSMKNIDRTQMDFNTSRARKEVNSKVKFSDVAGCDEVKAELVEVVDYFRNADKYTKLGAKLPKGVLLVGPPGTGKTLLAKAVAGEANVAFYSISGSDFVEMYVGVGAGRVRDMFKTAKQNAPCLIFIDEIDAVGRQRGAGLGGGNDEREQTLNQLLVEMDGFNDNSGVIVMAATNRSDILDPALLRAGRFDRQITVDLPDKNGREAILKVHSRNKKVDSSVDFANIANRTVGFSGADLANVMNEAAILAVRAKRNVITTKDIDEAIDRSWSGPARNSVTMSPEEKKQIAYHESGHAIIGLKLPYSDVVQKVTIVPRGRTGGHVLMTPENDRFIMTKNQILARITGYLGGRTSEEIFFGDVSTGASNDIEVATRLARAMVTEYGMSSLGPVQYDQNQESVFLGRDYNSTQRNFSAQVAYEIDKEIRNIIDECHKQANDILTKYKDDVILMAETLITKETLTAEEIKYLLENRHLPEEKVSDQVEEDKPEVTASVDKTEEGTKGVDLGSMTLPVEFNGFIDEFHTAISKNPRKVVVVAAVPSTNNVSFDQLKRIVYRFAPKEDFIGTVFLPRELYIKLPVSLDDFAQYLENEGGAELLLVKTSETSLDELKAAVYPTASLTEKLRKAKDSDEEKVIDVDPVDDKKDEDKK